MKLFGVPVEVANIDGNTPFIVVPAQGGITPLPEHNIYVRQWTGETQEAFLLRLLTAAAVLNGRIVADSLKDLGCTGFPDLSNALFWRHEPSCSYETDSGSCRCGLYEAQQGVRTDPEPDALHCDYCTKVENAADLTPDWNPETGNHLSCEAELEVATP